MRIATIFLLFTAILLALAAPEAARAVSPAEVAKLRAANDSSKLIVVVGQNPGSKADVWAFEKINGEWLEKYHTQGLVGRNGISAQKREGDGCTPAGTYSFGNVFGLADNPDALKRYVQLTPEDFWVDDPNSKYYNTWVHGNVRDKDWNSAEDLYSETVAYKYVAAINYNTSPVVPGAGSAIFLHCSTGRPTAGCVAVPEEYMVNFLRFINDNTKIVIAGSLADLAAY